MIRATTIGVLKNYRSGLNKAFTKLNDSRTTVLTHRNFNSFAEDPSAAALTFQLRRSRMTAESQYTVCDTAYRRFQTAWSSLETVVNKVDNEALNSVKNADLQGLNGPVGDAITALGRQMDILADTIVQVMNDKYGDNFLFSGADGQTVPFTWGDDGELLYRGIPVDASVPQVEMDAAKPSAPAKYDKDGNAWAEGTSTGDVYYKKADGTMISQANYDKAASDVEKLRYLSEDEKLFLDIGLGNKESEDGKVITSSVFDSTLQGINFLGWGKDADGDPKNIVSLVKEMAKICMNSDGPLNASDHDKLNRLVGKTEDVADIIKREHVAMDARSNKLKNNLDLLEGYQYTLTEQYSEIEDVDDADAISAFVWAQYSYNAALRVGNSVLAQSLMDYMQ